MIDMWNTKDTSGLSGLYTADAVLVDVVSGVDSTGLDEIAAVVDRGGAWGIARTTEIVQHGAFLTYMFTYSGPGEGFTVVQLEDELISHQRVGVVLAREDDDEGSVVVFDGQSLNRVPAPGYPALVMAELAEDVAGVNIAVNGASWTQLARDVDERRDPYAKDRYAVLVMVGGTSDLAVAHAAGYRTSGARAGRRRPRAELDGRSGSRAPSPSGGARLQQPLRAASAVRDRHAAVAHGRSARDPRHRATRRRLEKSRVEP